ncbi:MAG: GNAT family N-acetyltransferase [Rubrobacteraceae bacterium]|uniref:GNAT family N-acetyltransferase n=1 Tax=Rubrobacter naiadicus TaxID=1392641 RepID=UPI0023617E4F|nr:GNAT family N-acetyltransferase [Rubrobacter naiadicus]MBX6764645.1 GNAT family N-acetyltransferase [Rubrobacteraceae bacterium]MCL6439125.1 GNAT family N-acetyltransferase [Rubrobacteraceae bacterium]
MDAYLQTERLLLRRFTRDDVQNLFELDSDPEVVRYANPGGKTRTREEITREVLPRILSWYERTSGKFGYWAAIEKSSGEFLGWFEFRPFDEDPEKTELGYRLKRSAWGKGYATEGARALVEKGFTELGVEHVVAIALVENPASVRVMQKTGLRFERRGTYPMYPGRKEVEEVWYGLRREDFLRSGPPA